jgi:DNA-binding NarL/FixJ family response regulator
MLIDDHAMVRESVKTLLKSREDMSVAFSFGNTEEAFDCLRDNPEGCDLIIIDFSVPTQLDGTNAVKHLHTYFPEKRILVMSMHDQNTYAARLIERGASGYLMKENASTNLITAIQTVASGGTYLANKEILTHSSGYSRVANS